MRSSDAEFIERPFLTSAARDIAETQVLPVGGADCRASALSFAELQARARWIYDLRRQRDRLFGLHASLFRDPAWDMLLDLYAQESEDDIVSVSKIAIAACIPMSTALRYVDHMYRVGLIVRSPDAQDGRRSNIVLTSRGRELMAKFLRDLAVQPHASSME